eukprot:s228_g6.t1
MWTLQFLLPEHVFENRQSKVDFGRLMMNIRAEEQKVRIKNESAVAVRWQLLCKDSKSKAQAPSSDEPGEEGANPAEQAHSPAAAGLPEEIGVEPREGQLSAHEERGALATMKEREIRFSFKSGHPAQFKNTLQLEARDAEGLTGWHQAANVSVAAESFAVDAVIEPDPSNVPLDFGTVLVHTSAQRIFEIVNRGRFPAEDYARIRREAEAALKEAEKEGSPVSFDRPHADNKQNRFCCSGKKERAMRKEKMREYQEIDRQGNLESKERSAAGGRLEDPSPWETGGVQLEFHGGKKDELQPGERRAITVTCTPGRVFEAASEGIAVQIFDQLSGESVDHRIPPMRVTLTAVYNTFQVTPPRGLNFGPVEKGETQTRTFTIRNNGIFAFNWCLFDWADPPAIEEMFGRFCWSGGRGGRVRREGRRVCSGGPGARAKKVMDTMEPSLLVQSVLSSQLKASTTDLLTPLATAILSGKGNKNAEAVTTAVTAAPFISKAFKARGVATTDVATLDAVVAGFSTVVDGGRPLVFFSRKERFRLAATIVCSIPEGQAPPTKPQVAVGPFTVKPTSGNLDPDEDVQVQVTFQATADEDYDSKLAIWVDGVQGEPTMDGTAQGCSSYLLTGQSCVPGINTVDLQTVFEDQFFTRTLEDAIAIAGRLDVRVFSEADQIFHFGPVLVKERGVGSSQPASPTGAPPEFGVTENLRLTNPKAVPCKVQLSIKPREGDAASKAGGSSDAFEVFPQEVVISPHDSKQIQVKFTPTHLASFAAVLEAVVPQGTDPCSNYLSFELRGDGAVPSVSLQGPRIFGDEGGELDMGKLPLFRREAAKLELVN